MRFENLKVVLTTMEVAVRIFLFGIAIKVLFPNGTKDVITIIILMVLFIFWFCNPIINLLIQASEKKK